MSIIGRKVAAGAVLLAVLQLSFKFIDVLALILLARKLMPDDFGIVSLAVSILVIAVAVTDLPVSDALIQKTDIVPLDLDLSFTLGALRGVAVAIFLAASAIPMASIYNDERIIPIIVSLAIVPFFNGLNSPAMVMHLKRMEYGPTAKVQAFAKVVGTCASVGFAILFESYWALVVGYVASAIASTFCSYFIAPYYPRISIQGARQVLKFTGWITVSRIISTINLQSDRFFVGHIVGRSALGQYVMGSDISSLATYSFAGPVIQTMFSGFSAIKNDAARIRFAYLKSQRLLVMVVLPFGFMVSSAADIFVPLLFGKKWDQMIVVVEFLAPIIALQMFYLPLQSVVMAIGQPRILAVREGINFMYRLPLTIVGASYYGLIGAVVARCISGLLIVFMSLSLAKKAIGASVFEQIKNVWRSLFSVLVMYFLLYFLKYYYLNNIYYPLAIVAALLIIGSFVYALVHFLLWIFSGRPDGAEKLVIETLMHRVVRA